MPARLQEIVQYLRPDLGSGLRDHGESSRVIIEANPGDLLQGVKGCDQLVEGPDVLQLGLEPHGGRVLARCPPPNST